MPDLTRQSVPLGPRPALLLVDMISAFTRADSPLGGDYPQVLASNRRLLQAFRARDLPLVFTTVSYREDNQAPIFRRRLPDLNMLFHGSEWVEIDSSMDRRPHEPLIEKQYASAFFGTELAAMLHAQDVDSLVVTGLTTSGCVRATVVDALQHDFVVWVPREAVGDRNTMAHDANLLDMHAKYADVVSVNEVLAMLAPELVS